MWEPSRWLWLFSRVEVKNDLLKAVLAHVVFPGKRAFGYMHWGAETFPPEISQPQQKPRKQNRGQDLDESDKSETPEHST